MKRHLNVAALVALLLLSACSAGARTSRDLPRGMPLGIWGNKSGLFLAFKDEQRVSTNWGSGSYTLIEEDRLALTIDEQIIEIKVSIQERGKRIAISSIELGNHLLDHLVADTGPRNSRAGNLSGAWLVKDGTNGFFCFLGNAPDCEADALITFTEGGQILGSLTDNADIPAYNFELADETLLIEYPDLALGKIPERTQVFNFGEVLILQDSWHFLWLLRRAENFSNEGRLAIDVPQTPTSTEVSTVAGHQAEQKNGMELGVADAPIVMTIFTDFQSPYSLDFYTIAEGEIIGQYVTTGQVRLTYEVVGFLGVDSVTAAQAAYCAGEQDAFWEFRDVIFAPANFSMGNTGAYSNGRLLQMVSQIPRMDMQVFRRCLNDNEQLATMVAAHELASGQGISGIPAFVINGQVIQGSQPFARFQEIFSQLGVEAP